MYASVNWVIIGSGNGLSPVRRQAITWTNDALLSFGLMGTDFSEIGIGILSFSFKKMHLEMSSAKMVAICIGLSVAWYWTRTNDNPIHDRICAPPGPVELNITMPMQWIYYDSLLT